MEIIYLKLFTFIRADSEHQIAKSTILYFCIWPTKWDWENAKFENLFFSCGRVLAFESGDGEFSEPVTFSSKIRASSSFNLGLFSGNTILNCNK